MIAQEAVPNTYTVWITLIGSATTIATIVIVQLFSLKKEAREQSRKMDEQTVKIDETHVLVNSAHDEALKRADRAEELSTEMRDEIRQLKVLLRAANRRADLAERAPAKIREDEGK